MNNNFYNKIKIYAGRGWDVKKKTLARMYLVTFSFLFFSDLNRTTFTFPISKPWKSAWDYLGPIHNTRDYMRKTGRK